MVPDSEKIDRGYTPFEHRESEAWGSLRDINVLQKPQVSANITCMSDKTTEILMLHLTSNKHYRFLSENSMTLQAISKNLASPFECLVEWKNFELK